MGAEAALTDEQESPSGVPSREREQPLSLDELVRETLEHQQAVLALAHQMIDLCAMVLDRLLKDRDDESTGEEGGLLTRGRIKRREPS